MDRNDDLDSAILQRTALFRGIFLNQVTHIEKLIDVRISNHFCNEEKNALEMVDLILGDRFISFESKKVIFEIIIRKHNNAQYLINKPNFEKLTVVQNTRNKLAHLMIAVDKEAMEKFGAD